MLKGSIFILSEQKDLAERIQQILEFAGYQTQYGISSFSAVMEYLKNSRPDLILLDLNLSGNLIGIDKAIEINQNIDIPFVFLTDFHDEEHSMPAGRPLSYSLLSKRFYAQELLHVVEKALHSSQLERDHIELKSRNRSIFESVHDAVLIYSEEPSIILEVNPIACQIYGYSRDEFIGMSLSDIIWVNNSKSENNHKIAQENNQHTTSIIYHVSKGGKRIILEAKASPTTYNGQKAILSVNHDVTGHFNDEKNDDLNNRPQEVLLIEQIEKLRSTDKQLEMLNSAFTSISDGIIITNRDGQILWSNPAFSKLTGFSSEELLGNRPTILQSTGRYDENYAVMWQMILLGRSWKGELSNVRQDGSQYVSEIILNPITDSAGQINYFMAISHDISERKQIEQALRASENKYRKMLEMSPLIITMFDREKITYINPAGAKLFGFQHPDEIIGKVISDIIDPENFLELSELFVRLFQNPNLPLTGQVIRLFKPGEEPVYLEISIVIIQSPDPLVIQVIGQDVTEQRQVQAHLRRQSVIAEIELAIYRSNELSDVLDKIVDVVAKSLDATTGASVIIIDRRSGNLLVGGSNLSPAERNQLTSSHIKQHKVSRWILENKKPLIIPDTRLREKGTDLLLTNSQIRAFAGVPLIIESQAVGVLYVMDNHPRKYSKDDIDFLTSLANRTSLAIAKIEALHFMKEAKETAEATAQAKSRFLANMTHELRTPLTAIVGLSDLLENGHLTDQQIDFVRTIQLSAKRLLNLIRDVLDISRLEAGRFTLELHPFDLRTVINDALDILALTAAKKNLKLVCNISDQAPVYVNGDDDRLTQVITNLVSNAIKFTDHGDIIIRVNSRLLEDEVDKQQIDAALVELSLTVQDTGPGIPLDRQSSLFQEFSQVDLYPSQHFGGSGLGLVISKQLVELMGGEIHLHSSGVYGEGCIFTFTIRVNIVDGEPQPYLNKYQPSLSEIQVLLVESSSLSRSILREQFLFWGMKVEVFDSPVLALDWLISGNHPKFALLDKEFTESDDVLQYEILRQMLDEQGTVFITGLIFGKKFTAGLDLQDEFSIPVTPLRLYENLLQSVGQSNKTLGNTTPTRALNVSSKKGISILLAEDDPVNRKVLTYMLQNLGYEVDSSANGMFAIQALESKQYPIVIMDQQMPEMDGITVIRYIRQVWDPKEQPHIIAITADTLPGTRQLLLDAGAQDVLYKPLLLSTLINALAHIGNETPELHPYTDITPLSGEPINYEHLSELFTSLGDDLTDVHIEILKLFLDNSPSLVEFIELYSSQSEKQGLMANLHSLKGSSELFGADRLAYLCKSLEQALRAESDVDLIARVNDIKHEYSIVYELITSIYRQKKLVE